MQRIGWLFNTGAVLRSNRSHVIWALRVAGETSAFVEELPFAAEEALSEAPPCPGPGDPPISPPVAEETPPPPVVEERRLRHQLWLSEEVAPSPPVAEETPPPPVVEEVRHCLLRPMALARYLQMMLPPVALLPSPKCKSRRKRMPPPQAMQKKKKKKGSKKTAE
ncbi:hypothetical protein CYMTET_50805 [Cymbomonas tetramitiformis]|uniref:Uncharacterized protein n=1 Tax=Cymbomonas tetramitiformis TaxID=36881 RepID=A0AAE0BP29_9CHLO|nr:hypothetical protein CYMTET_50805 [Cymbomonas tetramitiformis]